MDGRRFDAFTMKLAAGASRRRVLKGLAGGAAAAGLTVVGGRGPAAAQACKADGKACKKNSQCCSGNCVGGTGSGSIGQSAGTCQPAVVCLNNNQACASSTDTCCTQGYACGNDFCGSEGQPFGCCGTQGAVCTNLCDCCDFLRCTENSCQPPELP